MVNEDEDLTRAIELSLQSRSQSRELTNLTSSDDDEEIRFQQDLKNAIEASHITNQQRPVVQQPDANNNANTSSSQSAFLSERARLETERLERQKRLRPDSFISRETLDNSEDEDQRPLKKHRRSQSSSVAGPGGSGTSSISTTVDERFWGGELRQTAVRHADPRKDGSPTFRLTDILGKTSDLALAILSSYSLDYSWIYSFFDPSVPVIMVAQPDASGEASVKIVLPNWVRTTPYLRAGFGCQHMKLMLLFYKDGRVRVVVSTANLIAYDWRDMENSVWLQDIPLRPKPVLHDPKADDFPALLQRALHAVNVRPALAAMIRDNHPDLPISSIDEIRQKWDWSKVKAQLVASIAGKHEEWPQVIQTGHPRLMAVIRKLGMRTGKFNKAKRLVLECQGSSIGAYTTQWLNEFHWSARGESAEDWLDTSKKSREKLPYPSIKIVFPTKATIQASSPGEQGGGTIFCRRKQWQAKNFPRAHFYDSRSKAGAVLMHSKMILGMLQDNPLVGKSSKSETSDTESDGDDNGVQAVEPGIGWVYVGSHNFTPSAWGTLSGSAFSPTLNISNYELGVVFLIKDLKEADRIACFQRPVKKYGKEDEPWMQEESPYHQS